VGRRKIILFSDADELRQKDNVCGSSFFKKRKNPEKVKVKS